MVQMQYRCESCGQAFVHEEEAQIHTTERGHTYEEL